jgi:8-oxo-dGTP diphosphatase
MARMPVVAAGGIVLRRQQPPLIAVVRLRKRDEWVLPKGKLDEGETARAAARREVLEETGHNVTVHEFLGTLAYDAGGRSKIVHYWRMEAAGEQAHELMNDVRAVDWLPLDAAIARLSRNYEQAFLENVGPQALAAFARKPKAKALEAKALEAKAPEAKAPEAKAPVLPKRRTQPVMVSEPAPTGPPREKPVAKPLPEAPLAPVEQQGELAPEPPVEAESPIIANDVAVAEISVSPAERESVANVTEADAAPATPVASDAARDIASAAMDRRRRSLAQKVRDWLGRAA